MNEISQIRVGQYADLMPDMSEEEYSALKQSIEQDGLRHPIEVTEEGVIVDGHHRFKACKELDIEPVYTYVEDASVEQAIRANFTRRNLSDGTKKEVVKAYLEDHWNGDREQQEIAASLGVDPATVSRAKRELEDSGKQLHRNHFPAEEKRQQVADYLEANPDASNREVANNIEADVSHPTVGEWRAEWEAEPDEEADESDQAEEPEPEQSAGEVVHTQPGPSQEPEEEPENPDEPTESEEGNSEEPDEEEELEPHPLDGSDNGGLSDRERRLISKVEDLNETIVEQETTIEQLEQEEEQAEREDGSASVKVLRRMLNECNGRVEERDSLLREIIRAYQNQDPEQLGQAVDRAEELVGDD